MTHVACVRQQRWGVSWALKGVFLGCYSNINIYISRLFVGFIWGWLEETLCYCSLQELDICFCSVWVWNYYHSNPPLRNRVVSECLSYLRDRLLFVYSCAFYVTRFYETEPSKGSNMGLTWAASAYGDISEHFWSTPLGRLKVQSYDWLTKTCAAPSLMSLSL